MGTLPEFAAASSTFELRHASSDHAVFVTVPRRRFLSITGLGAPAGVDFALAGAALDLASALVARRLRRRGLAVATRLPAHECLWAPCEPLMPDDVPTAFADRSQWTWRQLMELPSPAADVDVEAAIDEGRRRAGRDVALIRPIVFAEGPVAQWLHIGAAEDEASSVASLYEAISDADLYPDGWLHTVLLSGAVASRRHSIIRQPVSPFAELSIPRFLSSR